MMDTSKDTRKTRAEGRQSKELIAGVAIDAPGLYNIVRDLLHQDAAKQRLERINAELSGGTLTPDEIYLRDLEKQSLERGKSIVLVTLRNEEPEEVKQIVAYLQKVDFNYSIPTSDSEALSILRTLPFFPGVPSNESESTDHFACLFLKPTGQDWYINVPTSIISGAAAFNSWLGRGWYGNGDKSGHQSSRHAIIAYSKLTTPIPPVDYMSLTVYSDDLAVIKTGESHRVAAAKLRQVEFIQTKELVVMTENFPLLPHLKARNSS